jgi:hypothetical protein
MSAFFFSYTVEIEKGFGTCVAIPVPIGGAEMAVLCHEGLELFC